MVRLKVSLKIMVGRGFLGFNSKMVRLKGTNLVASNEIKLFQFQNGTIKSLQYLLLLLFVVRFNSKMVQLKESTIVYFSGALFSFNSKMVQLKAKIMMSSNKTIEGFNSKMVQLKAKNQDKANCFTAFQFQNGTIKRNRLFKVLFCKIVSIPKWYN